MASPPSSAQIPVRQLGQDICLDHQSEFLFCCNECSEQLVCRVCVTSTHQGHNFDNISDVASIKRRKIRDYIKFAEETEIRRISHQIDSTQKQLQDSTENLETLTDKIKRQGEKLKTEIDRITDLFVNTCQDVQQGNYDLLLQYMQSLQSSKSQLNDRLGRCKETLNSGSNIAVIDVEKSIQIKLKKPACPQLKNVEFTEGSFPSVLLQDDVGILSINEIPEGNAVTSVETDGARTSSIQHEKYAVRRHLSRDFSRENQEDVKSQPDKHTVRRQLSGGFSRDSPEDGKSQPEKHTVHRQLSRHFSRESQEDAKSSPRSFERTRSISASEAVSDFKSVDATVVSEFKYSSGITSVKKSTPERVWVSWYNDNYISLLTLQGALKQKVEVEHSVRDISVSPVTGNLWFCCYSDVNVYELSGIIFKTPTKRFTTEYSPSALCLAPDNKVVLCDDQHVTVYSTVGEELHSTKCYGKRMLVHPRHITVCATTGDIAVCDLDSKYHGGSDKSKVQIFDHHLIPKYQYHGPISSQVIGAMGYSFYPYDVVYEPQGRLIVADFMNKSIQLVSKHGQFLAIVYTDTLKPRALTLIQDGQLLVGFDDQTVKIIKYTV